MPNDYIKKEPSKTEKLMYELALHQQNLEHQSVSNSLTTLAVALAAGVDAEKIAKYLTTEEAKLREFGKTINEAIEKSKASEKPKQNEHQD